VLIRAEALPLVVRSLALVPWKSFSLVMSALMSTDMVSAAVAPIWKLTEPASLPPSSSASPP